MLLPVPLLSCVLALQQPPPADLGAELARAVDLPTPAARRAAADELAKKHGDVAAWRAACATFGTFAPKEPGPTKQTVDLQVLDQTEATEIHLYVPKGYDPAKPAPLLLWGHGAGGTGAREFMLWQAVADRIGLLILAPTEFGKEQGWGFTPRERAAQLAALRWARRTVNVDENAIFVGGWSRGGHMTWDLTLRHPDWFAGAIACVGGPRMALGAQNNLRYLENVVHLPIRDLQGSQDDPLLLVNVRLAFARLSKLGAKDAVLREFEDRGHDADLSVVDWAEFFGRRRVAEPPRAVRICAEKSEARAAWIEITGIDDAVKVDANPAIDPATFNRLDDTGQRAVLLDKLAAATARLAVRENNGQGRFVAEGRGVKSFALLLTAERLGKDGKVEVRWQNKPVTRRLAPDAAVLVREFVERFDRTFLPVVRVAVP